MLPVRSLPIDLAVRSSARTGSLKHARCFRVNGAGQRGLSRGVRARHEFGTRRVDGFMTPVGWLYLLLTLTVVVAVVAVLVWYIASANVEVAERTAEAVANAGAVVGLQHLVSGVLPGSPFPVIGLPEPQRTQAVIDQINLVAVPNGALARYLAPFQPGDIDVTVSLLAATVTVTARTGRTGQFVHTATRSAVSRAANRVEAGTVLEAAREDVRSGGVLPLAVDASAFRRLKESTGSTGSKELPIALGSNAFAVLADDFRAKESGVGALEAESQALLAAAEFLSFDGSGSPGGIAPPAFTVGQQLRLSQAVVAPTDGPSEIAGVKLIVGTRAAPPSDGAAETRAAALSAHNRELSGMLLERLEGRAVIVPLVDGDLVQGFAVASVTRLGEQGLGLELLPSALSPLARFDADAQEVGAALAEGHGLALGFSVSEIDVQDALTAGCCAHEITNQQAILSPVEIAG